MAHSYEEFDLSLRDMDEKKVDIPSDEVCIIAAPSFGGRVPGVAVKRLENIRGNGA